MLVNGPIKESLIDQKMFLCPARRPYVPVVFLALCLLVTSFYGARGALAESHALNCDIHQGACTQDLAGMGVIFDIHPKPVKAMTDLRFTVRFDGKQPEVTPYIDLGMPGMKMGPNRVALEAMPDGVFEGTGIIVRCPSGKRTWKATVTVPNLGAVEYIFDVIY